MSAMNPLGMSPQQGANMVGSLSSQSAQSSEPTSAAPEESSNPQVEFLETFKSNYTTLEKLNTDFGGSDEDFRAVQKAMETWVSNIVSKMPDSSQQSTQSQPTSPAQSPAPPIPGQLGY